MAYTTVFPILATLSILTTTISCHLSRQHIAPRSIDTEWLYPSTNLSVNTGDVIVLNWWGSVALILEVLEQTSEDATPSVVTTNAAITSAGSTSYTLPTYTSYPHTALFALVPSGVSLTGEHTTDLNTVAVAVTASMPPNGAQTVYGPSTTITTSGSSTSASTSGAASPSTSLSSIPSPAAPGPTFIIPASNSTISTTAAATTATTTGSATGSGTGSASTTSTTGAADRVRFGSAGAALLGLVALVVVVV